MERARWCHLMLRVLGVLFIGLAIPTAISSTFQLVRSVLDARAGGWGFGTDELIWYVVWMSGTYFQFGFGCYLLFKGRAVARWCLKGVDSCCEVCGCDLAGLTGGKCPECGEERVKS